MIDLHSDPKIWLLTIGASVLGVFARLANYYAGVHGKEVIENIYPQTKRMDHGQMVATFCQSRPA